MSLRDELIQVAAVAIAIVQDLDTGSTEMDSGYIGTVLGEVANERDRQEAKWGKQHHHPHSWLAILGEEVGEAFQAANDIVWPKEEQ